MMKRIFLVAVALSAWAGTAWGEEAPELRAKYARAFDLYGEKKYNESRQILAELWPRLKTHDVATLYGQVEMKQGNHAAAAQYFATALAKLPPTVSTKHSETLRKWLADMKKHVATYDVTANVAGAVLSVDGVDYGATPLEIPLFVGSGAHIVLLSLEGYRGGDARLNSVEGTQEKLELRMVAVEKPVASSAPIGVAALPPQPSAALQLVPVPPRDSGVEKPAPNYWVLAGGGAVAAGGLVTGLVFHTMANSKYDKAGALETKAGMSGCYGTRAKSSDCVNQSEYISDGDRDRTVSLVAFGVGGAALVATTVYWLWPRKRTASAGWAPPTLVSSIGPEGSWFGVSGSY